MANLLNLRQFQQRFAKQQKVPDKKIANDLKKQIAKEWNRSIDKIWNAPPLIGDPSNITQRALKLKQPPISLTPSETNRLRLENVYSEIYPYVNRINRCDDSLICQTIASNRRYPNIAYILFMGSNLKIKESVAPPSLTKYKLSLATMNIVPTLDEHGISGRFYIIPGSRESTI